MADEAVRIEGLSGLRKGLREADRELPKALTEAHKEVAEVVVRVARPNLRTKHGRTPRSRIAASGTQGGAFVRLGGPTAFGDEFGATRYHQFQRHKGTEGYAVYPAIRSERGRIMDMYADTVEEKVLKRAARAGD